MKRPKIVEEFTKERKVNPHNKYLIRGMLSPIAGFFLLLIPYTTYFAPFVFIIGGWYLAKWKYNIDNEQEEYPDTGESGETYNVEHQSNMWRNTDNA